MFFPKLKDRYNGPELMDNLGADSENLHKTLDDFQIINKLFSRSQFVLSKYIFKDILRENRDKITLLDIGSGGGDIDRWFVKRARSKEISATVLGIDHDQRSIDYAVKRCSTFPEISFIKMDAFDLEKNVIKHDYIIANHFLHHLDNGKIPQFIYNVNNMAKRGFLINDLLRSKMSYILFYLLFPFFSRSSFTWKDGLMSILKGFTCEEMNGLVRGAGLTADVKVFTLIPGRIIVTNL